MVKLTSILLSLLILIGSSSFVHAQDSTAIAYNKVLLHRLINEAYNARKLNIVDEIADSSYVEHTNGVTTNSSDIIKQTIAWLAEESEDFKLVIDQLIAEKDKVAMHWIYSGKNKKFDKQVILHGIYIGRFARGKLVEGWQIFDNWSRFKILGYTLISPTATKEE